MTSDGWVLEGDHCHFDLAVGFEAEWKAMDEPFVVVDLETTASCPEVGELLEFAAILAEPTGVIVAEFSMIVSVSRPVPELITSRTGLTQAEVDRQGQPLPEAVHAFLDFVGSRPVFIHNAPFDLAFLQWASKQAQRAFTNPVYDTMVMAVMAWSPVRCESIYALARHIGKPYAGTRAIDDARATLAVLLAIRAESGRRIRHCLSNMLPSNGLGAISSSFIRHGCR